MKERIDLRIVIFIIVMLLIFGSMAFVKPSITGYASSDPDDSSGFYGKYASQSAIDSAPQAFKDNIDVVEEAYKAAVDHNIGYPEIFIAQIYKESSLIPNQLSCVCASDKDRDKWVEYASCEGVGCHEKVSQMSCTYPGCDDQQLERTKGVSKNYGKYQTSCCVGLGQVWYLTAYDMGFRGSPSELLEPSENLDVAAKYMARLIDRYEGDYVYALAAYNWGMGNVDDKREIYGTDYASLLGALPAETRTYVATILSVAPIALQMIEDGKIVMPDFQPVDDVDGYVTGRYNFKAPALSQIPTTMIEVTPNFKADIPYMFDDYEMLREDAEELVEECDDPGQTERCIEDKLDEYNHEYQYTGRKFVWHYGDECLKQSSSLPDDFVEFLSYVEDCANTVNDDCVCSPRPGGDHDYRFDERGNNLEVSVQIGNSVYKEVFQFLELSDSAINTSYGQYFMIGTPMGTVEFLGKDSEGKLTEDPNLYVRCVSSASKQVPFCVTSEQKMLRYDGATVRQDNVVYRFALTFGNIQDSPVTGSSYIRDGIITSAQDDIEVKVGDAV